MVRGDAAQEMHGYVNIVLERLLCRVNDQSVLYDGAVNNDVAR